MGLKELDILIPQYAMNKEELDSYKKLCDAENKRIKEVMSDFAVQHYETGDYKATYITSKRESMDEELLLELLSNVPEIRIHNIIKTKEYIDFDALENAIYKGLIPNDVISSMDKARETKEIITLKVTRKKGGKKE